MSENPFDNAFKLRRALVAISERQGSQLRSTLDQFLRHVSPGMVNSHADFPVTVRRHPVDKSRCVSWLSRDQMLCFQVGSAVLRYYDTVTMPKSAAANQDFMVTLSLLEEIGTLGLDEFIVVGTDSIGYTLRNKADERRDLIVKQKTEEARQKAELEAEERRALRDAPKAKAK